MIFRRVYPLLRACVAAGCIGACVGSCTRSPTDPPDPVLQFRLVLDSTAFRYGEPVGWRLEQQNVTSDSLAFGPLALSNELTFALSGPQGPLRRKLVFIDVVGLSDWLHAGEQRNLLQHPYPLFVIDWTERGNVLPALPPGLYSLRIELRIGALRDDAPITVAAVAADTFRILAPAPSYRDSVDSAADSFVALTHALAGGRIPAESVIVRLDSLERSAGVPLWLGVLMYEVRGQVLSRAWSPRLDSMMQSVVERYVSAHPERALASNMIGALDSTRRLVLCQALAARGVAGPNVRTACHDVESHVRH